LKIIKKHLNLSDYYKTFCQTFQIVQQPRVLLGIVSLHKLLQTDLQAQKYSKLIYSQIIRALQVQISNSFCQYLMPFTTCMKSSVFGSSCTG